MVSTVEDQLQDMWIQPAENPPEDIKYKAIVVLEVNEAGKIISSYFRQQSGWTLMDHSIMDLLEHLEIIQLPDGTEGNTKIHIPFVYEIK